MQVRGWVPRNWESASLTVELISEAAAIPVIDETRGRAVEMYVALKKGLQPSRTVEDQVTATIEHEIGKIARPVHVWIVPDMPKTRSGKIMRRVLAAISNFAEVAMGIARWEVRLRSRCEVQAASDDPVMSFQVAKRSAISVR